MQHHHHLVFSLKFLTVVLRSSPLHFNYWSKTGGRPANNQEYCGFHRRFSDEFSSERKPVAVLLLPAVTETTEGWVSQVLKLREAQLIQQLINSSLSRHLNTKHTERNKWEKVHQSSGLCFILTSVFLCRGQFSLYSDSGICSGARPVLGSWEAARHGLSRWTGDIWSWRGEHKNTI